MTDQQTIRPRDGESGYTLIAVMFLLFLLTLTLGIAAPRMARQIQLDRERETMQRALQYRRAIQLYYRKFRAYPPTLDALVKTNEIRFLRKKYIDPITGKDDWKLIHYGQNKTQTLGFFGQPLAGGASTVAGVGATSGTGSLSGSSSLFGSSSSTDSSSTATSTSTGSSATTGTSTTSSFGTSTSLTSSTSSSSGSSSSGQTFGGLGIIGVSPNSAKQSIMIYKKKTHYNEWEFFYDPISDQKMTSSSLGSLSSSSSGSLTSSSSSSFGTSSSSSTASTGSTSSPSSF